MRVFDQRVGTIFICKTASIVAAGSDTGNKVKAENVTIKP